MVKSMTGFGRGEFSDGKRNVSVEVKAVNHRYGDISVKMAKRYGFVEDKVKKIAKETVKRGKAELYINVENVEESDVDINIDLAIAKNYMEGLGRMKETLGLGGEITISYVASLPDVMKTTSAVLEEEEVLAAIKKGLIAALENLDAMRSDEGKALAEDLIQRGMTIRNILSVINERAPQVAKIYAEKLQNRIKELTAGAVDLPGDRILMETAIFADKAGITEEIVRLESHIEQFEESINADGPVGKKLDFLVQEMNREANTIGAKANDLKITEHMLELKSEIEKIREQIQNIE